MLQIATEGLPPVNAITAIPRKRSNNGCAFWTLEMDEYAISQRGIKSATLIAADLTQMTGYAVTRNAVLGRMHRLNVARLAPTGPANGRSAARKRNRGTPGVRRSPTKFEETNLENMRRLPLMELLFDQCHYVLGEPTGAETIYCGLDVQAGFAYCGGHCARMYEPGKQNQGVFFKQSMTTIRTIGRAA